MLSLLALLTACQMTSSPSHNIQSNQERRNEISTEPIHLAQLLEKLANKETFYVYVGRPTCPYCRKFEPTLLKAMEDTQIPVFYLNTDEEELTEINNFVDSQGIETIPHLTYYKDGEKGDYLVQGSEASIDDIKVFLTTAPNP